MPKKTKQSGKAEGDLDFQISFYEGILAKSPEFVEALMVLGDLYAQRQWYDKSLKVDKRLNRIRPMDPIVLYNLACSYSLSRDLDLSLESIKEAIKYGYSDLEFLEHDRDLENLRNDSRFKQFYSGIKKKRNDRHA